MKPCATHSLSADLAEQSLRILAVNALLAGGDSMTEATEKVRRYFKALRPTFAVSETAMLSEERIIAWVRMMPRKADGSYDVDSFTVLDVEACIRGALKEQARMSATRATDFDEANKNPLNTYKREPMSLGRADDKHSTPRTDAFEQKVPYSRVDLLKHARQLERELAQAEESRATNARLLDEALQRLHATPSAIAEWKPASADDPTRQVAWIDERALYVGRIVDGQRVLLRLPRYVHSSPVKP